ncbi:MAG: radical SAM protein, partial [bacterium]|nr:radical SAM protein [bacterium]
MDIVEAVEQVPGLVRKLANLERNPLPDTPVLSAKIKLLWQCNLSCTFCRLPAMTRPMPKEMVHRILKDLMSHGLRKIHFSGGEIFMHPDIMPILEDACSMGLQVNFTSNGTRITKDVARCLVEMGIHSISISLDG